MKLLSTTILEENAVFSVMRVETALKNTFLIVHHISSFPKYNNTNSNLFQTLELHYFFIRGTYFLFPQNQLG